MELSPPVAITLRGIAGQLVVTTSVSSTGTVVLVVEELGIVVDVVEVVEVVEVVDVVEVVEVVVVPRSVAGGASADIESTASGDGAIVEELVVELS
jgi:hypothetical protein